ncbi:MAG TPA: hypothetical protein VFG94_12370 [Acidimicrobiales bacterium]|nr:hypothetical protein [Acidimicrobiales bacterium]
MASFATTFASAFGAIAWFPEIRNILAVAVGVIVLCGSVYLLIGTNVGSRTGLLVALAGLFGWMATMGVIWWIYGIGMQGSGARWHVEELNYSDGSYAGLVEANLDEAHSLTALAELPSAQELLEDDPSLLEDILPPELFEPGQEDILEARAATISIGQIIEARPELVEQYDDALDGWELLPVSDRQRGDAAASADAFLGPDGRGLFEGSSGYVVRDVFSIGGKPQRSDDSLLGRAAHKLSTILKFRHPTHHAVVQVQAVVPHETVPGEAPAPPEIDENAPIVSVIMVRDLGDKRFPAFMTALSSTLLFALFAWMLHRRDDVIARVRAT